MKKNTNLMRPNIPTLFSNRELDLPFERPEMFRSPFNLMRRFTDNMERMFDDLTPFDLLNDRAPELRFPLLAEMRPNMWMPQIETLEKDNELILRAELPGMKLENINVEIKDNLLTLSGERKIESEETKDGIYRSEFNYGSFMRTIPLPEGVIADKATAVFKDGVLEVKMAVPAGKLTGKKLEIKPAPPEPAKAKAANVK